MKGYMIGFECFCLILLVFFSNIINGQQISEFIHVDQFGYSNSADKVAVISNPQIGYNGNQFYSPGSILQIRNLQTEAIVYSGAPTIWNNGNTHVQSGDKGWWFDFSSVTATGSYYVYDPSTGQRSASFEINNNPYDKVINAAMKTFYYNRCNDSKATPYAQAIWSDGDNFPQDYRVRDAFNQNNAAKERDMAGGWFDAGDYNKYVTFAHDPIHQLLSSYEENMAIYTDDWNIPESGDGIPDILNEIKWELDWMRKMINADGTVHIKMGSVSYNDNSLAPPSANTDTRYYGPVCSSASLSIASSFAHAVKVFRTIPALASYANLLENDAVLCWNAFLPFFNSNSLQLNCDDGTVKAGDADMNTELQVDYAVVAASYLYDITGNNTYSNFVATNINNVAAVSDNYWAVKHAVVLEALLNYTTLSGANQTAVNTILTSTSDAVSNNWGNYFGFNEDDLYRAFVPDWIYYWGSNMGKANAGNMCQIMAKYNVLPLANASLSKKADELLHYFHGVNPLGITYLSNMYQYGGDRCANRIYHSWFDFGSDWDDAINSLYGPAPGFLAGGPNQSYSGSLTPPANQPLQKSYLDYNNGSSDVAYEITEPAIYYQAAYIRLLANYVNNQTVTSVVDIGATSNCIEIFPDPANNYVQIRGNLEAYSIQILNQNGVVYQNLNVTGSDLVIDISSLPSGLFFIRMVNQQNALLSIEKILKVN